MKDVKVKCNYSCELAAQKKELNFNIKFVKTLELFSVDQLVN